MIDNDTPDGDFISLIESSAQVWMIDNDTPGDNFISLTESSARVSTIW